MGRTHEVEVRRRVGRMGMDSGRLARWQFGRQGDQDYGGQQVPFSLWTKEKLCSCEHCNVFTSPTPVFIYCCSRVVLVMSVPILCLVYLESLYFVPFFCTLKKRASGCSVRDVYCPPHPGWAFVTQDRNVQWNTLERLVAKIGDMSLKADTGETATYSSSCDTLYTSTAADLTKC